MGIWRGPQEGVHQVEAHQAYGGPNQAGQEDVEVWMREGDHHKEGCVEKQNYVGFLINHFERKVDSKVVSSLLKEFDFI